MKLIINKYYAIVTTVVVILSLFLVSCKKEKNIFKDLNNIDIACLDNDEKIITKKICLYRYKSSSCNLLFGNTLANNKKENLGLFESISEIDNEHSKDVYRNLVLNKRLDNGVQLNQSLTFCKDSLIEASIRLYSESKDSLSFFVKNNICVSKTPLNINEKLDSNNEKLYSADILIQNSDIQ